MSALNFVPGLFSRPQTKGIRRNLPKQYSAYLFELQGFEWTICVIQSRISSGSADSNSKHIQGFVFREDRLLSFSGVSMVAVPSSLSV